MALACRSDHYFQVWLGMTKTSETTESIQHLLYSDEKSQDRWLSRHRGNMWCVSSGWTVKLEGKDLFEGI
eukprot:scaffold80931_cov73-Cyclotella_meneghiniana.AAC.2